MRKSTVLGVLLSIATASSVGIASAQTAAAPVGKVVGIIDRDKVVANYPKAQQAAEELKRMEERLNKLVEDANKQYDEAKKANKPQAELDSLAKKLQSNIDSETKLLQTRVSGLEGNLEKAVDTAIQEEAKVKHVDVVFLKQAVLFGGVDLTDGVLNRLTVANTAKAPSAIK